MKINFSLVSTKLIIHVILLEKIRLNHHQLIEMSSVTIDDKKNSFASDFSLCPLEENKEQKIDIELDLSFSQLTELPENLPSSLQKLYCSNNKLTELPENLPNSLQILYCYSNQLTKLPENLPNSIQELDCSSNQLTKLPENLPSSLQILYCYNNQLTELPENLPNSIQKLDCSNNPYLYIPKKHSVKFNIKETY